MWLSHINRTFAAGKTKHTDNMTKNRFFCIPLLMAAAMAATAGDISYTTNPQTGAVSSISIDGDTTRMDWMLRTDGKQYAWVTERYGWGLGYMTVNGRRYEWRNPEKSSGDVGAVSYKAGGISIEVSRKPAEGGFTESYTFINNSGADARLIDMGIYTPFNDNYPDSRKCMAGRCNAHIWPGGNAAYVNAVRMRGTGGGVGLAVTEGSITAYDVWERGREKGMSNYRGVIALCPPDTVLRSGGRMSVTWRVFSHEGSSDFRNKLTSYGGAVVSSPKYVYETGETATVEIETAEGRRTVSRKITGPGEVTVSLAYGNGKTTFAQLLGVSSYEGLIAKRIGFILDRQQMNDPADPRYGAFMVYDNELGKIYLNDGARASSDTDEGRERVGMGLLLAKWYARHPDGRLREALVRYAAFIRNRLQTADYTTYSKASKTGKIRGYNYPWIADFYFHMYGITGDRQ